MKALVRMRTASVAAAIVTSLAAAAVRAQFEPMTEDNVIAGTMNIDFKMRTNPVCSTDEPPLPDEKVSA